MNFIYLKHRLIISFSFYVLLVFFYFAFREFLIPTFSPNLSIDSSFALSMLASAKEESSAPVIPKKELDLEKILETLEEKPKEIEPEVKKEEPKQEEIPIKEPLPQKEKEQPKKDLKKEALEAKRKDLADKKAEAAKRKRAMEEETVITEASFVDSSLSNASPKYPIISKKDGEEGEVILLVRISSEGLPMDIVIYQSSGFERLDNASMYAVKNWRFIPAKNKFGGSLESVIKIPFVFKLKDGGKVN